MLTHFHEIDRKAISYPLAMRNPSCPAIITSKEQDRNRYLVQVAHACGHDIRHYCGFIGKNERTFLGILPWAPWTYMLRFHGFVFRAKTTALHKDAGPLRGIYLRLALFDSAEAKQEDAWKESPVSTPGCEAPKERGVDSHEIHAPSTSCRMNDHFVLSLLGTTHPIFYVTSKQQLDN